MRLWTKGLLGPQFPGFGNSGKPVAFLEAAQCSLASFPGKEKALTSNRALEGKPLSPPGSASLIMGGQ
jgi:hypothetical protein